MDHDLDINESDIFITYLSRDRKQGLKSLGSSWRGTEIFTDPSKYDMGDIFFLLDRKDI